MNALKRPKLSISATMSEIADRSDAAVRDNARAYLPAAEKHRRSSRDPARTQPR